MGHEALMTAAVKERVVGECEGWLRAGLSIEPCDRAGAEAAVVARYRAHGLSAPETVVWMDSPLGGALASWVLRHGFEHRVDGRLFTDADAGPPRQLAPEFAEQVERQLREQLAPGAGGHARPMLAGPFGDALVDAQKALVEALGAPLRDMLSVAWDKGESGAYELNEEMENALRWQAKPNDVLSEFGLLVYKDLLANLRGPIPARIVRPEVDRGDVITPPPPPSREELHLWEQFGGALDSWSYAEDLIHWRCMLYAAGLPASPALDAEQDVLFRVGRWWPLEGAAVLTERPVVLRYEEPDPGEVDPTDVLIRYADGYQLEA
ncbi:hypothetical protein [Streptomyces sp. NBC_00038]|uniref:hypothetical protein n=1 Tax=Streptomyces sp. NBC_00038 TaxID=2903615 RepID=UPI0022511099|nr:hypothetical protein [Streptomyces sp. NBC_00038]MCX5559178.1 hypothetical protein [Streptomyces sp. NBC_00038]